MLSAQCSVLPRCLTCNIKYIKPSATTSLWLQGQAVPYKVIHLFQLMSVSHLIEMVWKWWPIWEGWSLTPPAWSNWTLIVLQNPGFSANQIWSRWSLDLIQIFKSAHFPFLKWEHFYTIFVLYIYLDIKPPILHSILLSHLLHNCH